MTDRSRQNSFNAWYGRHSEEFNEKRRKRYQENAEIRAKARQQAAAYRKHQAELDNPAPPKRGELYTSARVAAILGVSTQTLRNWEARYMIPKATFGRVHRLYSHDQVLLMQAMVEASGDRQAFDEARRVMFMNWGESDE